MTMLAAEARAGAASREKVLADSRSGARPLGNSEPGGSSPAASRYSRSDELPVVQVRSPQRSPRLESSPAPRTRKPSSSSRGSRPGYTRAATQFSSPEFSNYQGIILAEFVMAELLVSATPIATSKQDASSGQYLSPYVGSDMVKMLSIGMLFFLLELSAVFNGKAGRMAAWFGGLILIVVGLNEANNIAKVFNLFGQGLAKASGAQQPVAAEGSAGNALQIFNQGASGG